MRRTIWTAMFVLATGTCTGNVFAAEPIPEATEIAVTGDAPFTGVPQTFAMTVTLEQTAGTAREAASQLDIRTKQLQDALGATGVSFTMKALGDLAGAPGALRAGAPLTLRRGILVQSGDRVRSAELMDLLLRVPGSTVTPPEYIHMGPPEGLEQAAALASTRAHTKALRVADALGVRLGSLISVIVTEEPEGEAIRNRLASGSPMGPESELRLRVFATVRYSILRP